MPLREPFEISSGRTTDRRILLLTIEDADGAAAWSECVAGERPHFSAETIDTAWLAITEWIAPRVLGQTIRHPEAIAGMLHRSIRGHPMAKAAVEMGVWAVWAERAETSLSRLLGGTRAAIATGMSIGIQPDPDALAARAAAAQADGYRRIKMKIRPDADIAFVGAAREALGPDAPLTADANSAYTPAHADQLADLDAFGLQMIEQPLAQDDLRRHAQLQDRLRTPICLDESIPHAAAAEDMLALGAGRIVNIKPGRVGGFTEARAIHDFCRRHAVPVWCGGMLESGIGRAHNVALASLPHFTLPGDVSPSARYWTQDIVTPPWTMDRDGMVAVPADRPGLGITVDVDRIDDLTARRRVLAAR